MTLISQRPQREPRIPVTIIGGYLGAGKTTLINRILRQSPEERLTVLVNDFGSINIDADLIEAHDGETIKLTNGCVCCSIAGDLGGALASASAQSPRPERIVIEASGVADPGRIANFARGRAEIGIDGIIVLADVETVQARCADRYVGNTVQRQLSAADLVVLTKTDVVTDDATAEIRAWLSETFAGKPIVNSREWASELLTACSPHHVQLHSIGEMPAHKSDHIALTLPCSEPVARERLSDAVTSLSGEILRCKGWLRSANTAQTVQLIQGVGGRLEFSDNIVGGAERWLGLVVICRNDGTTPERIERILRPVLSFDAGQLEQVRREGVAPRSRSTRLERSSP